MDRVGGHLGRKVVQIDTKIDTKKGTQARLPQFFFVRAQRRNNSLGRMHDKHCCTREKRRESVFGLLFNGPSVALKTQISAHRQVRNRVGEGRVGELPSEPLWSAPILD
jgi:hypothetical protein